MNRFRKLGFIEYNGRIKVHKSLLNVILHDHLTEQKATVPVPREKSKRLKRRPASVVAISRGAK
jgi:CRP/FNR family cyclic AMP-dependent transcriptional regulator